MNTELFYASLKTLCRVLLAIFFITIVSACGGSSSGNEAVNDGNATDTSSSDWDAMKWDNADWG